MNPESQRDKEKEALVETKWLYKGKILSFKLETYQFKDKTKTAEILHHPGAVVIIPVTSKGNLLLIRQWRRAAAEILLELPAGTLEKGEDPLACAQRELQEETGFKANKITPLGGFYTAPGFCDEYLHLYLAEDLSPSVLTPDEDEAIEVFSFSIAQVKQMLDSNELRDAKTIAGVLRYFLCVKH